MDSVLMQIACTNFVVTLIVYTQMEGYEKELEGAMLLQIFAGVF
jgi:hypothetical protein